MGESSSGMSFGECGRGVDGPDAEQGGGRRDPGAGVSVIRAGGVVEQFHQFDGGERLFPGEQSPGQPADSPLRLTLAMYSLRELADDTARYRPIADVHTNKGALRPRIGETIRSDCPVQAADQPI